MKKNSSDYKIRRADAISAPSPTGFRRNPYFNAYGGGGWCPRRTATTPNPSLPRRGIVLMTSGEPRDHEVFAQDDTLPIPSHFLTPGFGGRARWDVLSYVLQGIGRQFHNQARELLSLEEAANGQTHRSPVASQARSGCKGNRRRRLRQEQSGRQGNFSAGEWPTCVRAAYAFS
jgi:hypothetical protein